MFAIDKIINIIGVSPSFRGAEYNFELILPYIDQASRKQIVTLLKKSTENGQVCNAALCATKYLPPLFKSHGRFLDSNTRKELKATLARYNR